MPTPVAGYDLPNFWDTGDVLEVTVEGMNEGSPWALVRHYRVEDATTSASIAPAAKDKWEDDILPDMADELCDQWKAECITISRAAPGPITNKFYPLTAIPGVITTDAVPNGSALVLRFNTTETGKRGRGRMYVPGLPEASTNAGLLLASKVAAWQAIGDKMHADLSGTGYNMTACVFSRQTFLELPNNFTQAQYLAASGEMCPSITECAVVGNLGSQRDRRYRRNVYGA